MFLEHGGQNTYFLEKEASQTPKYSFTSQVFTKCCVLSPVVRTGDTHGGQDRQN